MPVKTTVGPDIKTVNEAIVWMTKTMAESQAKTDLAIRELSKKQAESQAETDLMVRELSKTQAESQAKTDLAIRELSKTQTELSKTQAESQAKTDLAIRLLTERIDDLASQTKDVLAGFEEVSTGFGTIGKRLGTITELIIIPGLRNAINAYGHDFRRTFANKKFHYIGTNGKKRELAEIDLYLSNGTEALAAEIKSTLDVGRVGTYLEKLRRIRKYEVDKSLTGKKLYGAVAGIYIDNDARKVAKKNGLYVIEILEEDKKLRIDAPKTLITF